MDIFVEQLNKQFDSFLADLEHIVNMDTPSGHKEHIDLANHYIIERFSELIGGQVDYIAQAEQGDQIKLHLGKGNGQIMILTHIDTVWPLGETAKRPFQNDGTRLHGPGVFDMKCGLLQGLYAMYAVVSQCQPTKNIVLFINSDEEIASVTSRQYIEEEAKKSDAVFVLEPALGPEGKLKTARKGVGRFQLEIEGISAHSGIDHQSGVSAIEELAHQIIYLQQLTDYTKGSTINVGVISGGTAFNVVSAHAKANLEARVETMEEADRLTDLITNLQPALKGTKLQVQGGMVRPPMEATVSLELFEQAQRIASNDLGFSLEEVATGGASDGNFTAALGVKTLDGLGAVGAGAHAIHEYVELSTIIPRTALLAHLLKEHSC